MRLVVRSEEITPLLPPLLNFIRYEKAGIIFLENDQPTLLLINTSAAIPEQLSLVSEGGESL